jgi:hypothetical protein
VLPAVGPETLRRLAQDQALASAQRAALAASLTAPGHLPMSFSHQVKYRAGLDPSWAPEFGSLMDLVPGSAQAEVVAAGGQVEVWARALAGGDVALLLFNNAVPGPRDVQCNATCLGVASGGRWGPTTTLRVRDVWARTDNGTVVGQVTAVGVPTNATAFLRLSVVG